MPGTGSFGYLFSAHSSDHGGRRKTFMILASAAAVTVVSYTFLPLGDALGRCAASAYVFVLIAAALLPETRGQDLELS